MRKRDRKKYNSIQVHVGLPSNVLKRYDEIFFLISSKGVKNTMLTFFVFTSKINYCLFFRCMWYNNFGGNGAGPVDP